MRDLPRWVGAHWRIVTPVVIVVVAVPLAAVLVISSYASRPTAAISISHAGGSPQASASPTATPRSSATPSLSPTGAQRSATATAVVSGPVPAARSNAAMAYDRDRKQVVLVGGISGGAQLGDTWTWDGSRWTARNALPTPNNFAVAAWDGITGKVLLFNGKTWLWDGAKWSEQHPAHSPDYSLAMAYDDALGKVVLVSMPGFQSIDTWEWSGTDWTELHITPPGGNQFTMDYDASIQKLVLYEANTQTTWSFDGSAWTKILTEQPQFAFQTHDPLVRDDALGGLVLIGPAANGNDTWVWDGAHWSKKAASLSPSRFSLGEYPSATYDAAMQKVVLFGGDTPGSAASGETWAFDRNSWEKIAS